MASLRHQFEWSILFRSVVCALFWAIFLVLSNSVPDQLSRSSSFIPFMSVCVTLRSLPSHLLPCNDHVRLDVSPLPAPVLLLGQNKLEFGQNKLGNALWALIWVFCCCCCFNGGGEVGVERGFSCLDLSMCTVIRPRVNL